jgi:hypothetical protein
MSKAPILHPLSGLFSGNQFFFDAEREATSCPVPARSTHLHSGLLGKGDRVAFRRKSFFGFISIDQSVSSIDRSCGGHR